MLPPTRRVLCLPKCWAMASYASSGVPLNLQATSMSPISCFLPVVPIGSGSVKPAIARSRCSCGHSLSNISRVMGSMVSNLLHMLHLHLRDVLATELEQRHDLVSGSKSSCELVCLALVEEDDSLHRRGQVLDAAQA